MKILLTGANGQLGTALKQQAPAWHEVHACDAREFNLTDRNQMQAVLTRLAPACIINAAAYTAVDQAEQEADKAWAVNAAGVKSLAEIAAPHTAIIHISTDFVFDGSSKQPYQPADKPNPLGAYGSSKLAGEQALLGLRPDRAMVVRTSWLYGPGGHNFVLTMLRLMDSRDTLAVVNDQFGCPTSVNSLARVIWEFATRPGQGVFHWSDQGLTSWHGFAVEIQKQALALGLLQREIPIRAIPAADYPTPAKRPAYSVLDNSSTCEYLELRARPWQLELAKVLQQISQSKGNPNL
ncbi:MAG: dTDP-4-dehydrorhamnose reductase [Pseudohongiellaceae bacterium]